MASKKPAFITGANAKIKVGGKTFAYAADVSYQVQVDTVPIETMGRYEAVTNEPVNYSVSGELSVVRYTQVAKDNNMAGANTGGNGLGKVNFTTGGNGADHINPGNILFSQTWDLSVYQKAQSAVTAAGAQATTTEAAEFITIKDCRFNRKSAGINKRGILVERLSFVGILMHDESFESSNSGDTDLS
jgi:hypothetical protein